MTPREKANRMLRDVLRRCGKKYTEDYCRQMCNYIGDRIGPMLPSEMDAWSACNHFQHEIGMCIEFTDYPRDSEVWG